MNNVKKRGSRKGAAFFTIDAIIAGAVFLLSIVFIFSFYVQSPNIEDTQIILDNYVEYISQTKLSNFYDLNRHIYQIDGNPREHFTVHQEVAYLYELGDKANATAFLENVTNETFPKKFGVAYEYNDEVIYSQNGTTPYNAIKTNLTAHILTFFEDDAGNLVGPEITKVYTWS